MTSRRSRPSPFLTALAAASAFLLASCGPLASGQDARVPYVPEATYAVPAGSSLYVTLELPLEEVGLVPADLPGYGFTWIPLGIRGESANAARIVTLPPPDAPEDWSVRLWQARILREVPLADLEGPYAYRLEAEVRVDVPASAEGLVRRVRGQLEIDGGETLPLDFLVRAE